MIFSNKTKDMSKKHNLHKINAMLLIAETLTYKDKETKKLRDELHALMVKELTSKK